MTFSLMLAAVASLATSAPTPGLITKDTFRKMEEISTKCQADNAKPPWYLSLWAPAQMAYKDRFEICINHGLEASSETKGFHVMVLKPK